MCFRLKQARCRASASCCSWAAATTAGTPLVLPASARRRRRGACAAYPAFGGLPGRDGTACAAGPALRRGVCPGCGLARKIPQYAVGCVCRRFRLRAGRPGHRRGRDTRHGLFRQPQAAGAWAGGPDQRAGATGLHFFSGYPVRPFRIDRASVPRRRARPRHRDLRGRRSPALSCRKPRRTRAGCTSGPSAFRPWCGGSIPLPIR